MRTSGYPHDNIVLDLLVDVLGRAVRTHYAKSLPVGERVRSHAPNRRMVTGRPLLLTAEDEVVTVMGCRRLAARARVGQTIRSGRAASGRAASRRPSARCRCGRAGLYVCSRAWINRQWGCGPRESSARTKIPKPATNQVTTPSGNGRHAATQSDTAISPTCGNPIPPDPNGRIRHAWHAGVRASPT